MPCKFSPNQGGEEVLDLKHVRTGADAEQPGSPMSPTTRAAVRAAQADVLAEAAQFQAPTLRRSTLVRVEEAQKERQRTEQVRPADAQRDIRCQCSHFVGCTLECEKKRCKTQW